MAKKTLKVVETQLPNGILKREYAGGLCTEYICMDVLENQMRNQRRRQAAQRRKEKQ